MKVNRKIQASAKSSRKAITHQVNKKVYVQNIEIGSRKQLEHPPNLESTPGERFHPKHLAKKKKNDIEPKGIPQTLMPWGSQQKP
jgi:hypothetical protein